jgi:hypothetical protein
MATPATRPVAALVFGGLGFVLSLGFLLGIVDGTLLARATARELVVAAVGGVAAAAMSVVILSDAVGLRRRSHAARAQGQAPDLRQR